MKTLFISLVVVLLVSNAVTVNCPISSKSQVISSIEFLNLGIIDLSSQSNTKEQNLIFNHQFQSSFDHVPSIGIGLNQISANKSKKIDIDISPAKTTSNGVYFKVKSGEQSQWKNLKINFLASTHKDIQIGSAFVHEPAPNKKDQYGVEYSFAHSKDKNGLRINSFVKGFDVDSQSSQIGFKQQTTNVIGQKVYLTFSSQRKSIIRALSISVIVYNIYTPNILFADGILDQNYVESTLKLTIPTHGINELRTYLVGINSFEVSVEEAISITSAIDETFSLVIGPIDRSKIDYISVSYLILSIIDCGSCSGYPLLYDNICHRNCPPGTLKQNNQCVPIKCEEKYQLNQNHECVPICGLNQILLHKRCVCEDGYYRIQGKCIKCKEGEYFDYKEVACKPLCTFNSFYQNGRCFCNQGFYIINGRCQRCPFGTNYIAETQRCVDICTKDFEIYSPEGCICKNGYYRIGEVCGRCPYQRVYNPVTQNCDCPAGFQHVLGICMKACGQSETRREDGVCICLDSYFRMNDGVCRTCPQHSSYHSLYANCTCAFPYMSMNGSCQIVCRENEYLNEQTQTCVSHCKQYLEVYVNEKCQCTEGYQRLKDGTCSPVCRSNSIRINDHCTCVAGYTLNEIKECVFITCPPATKWNTYIQDCVSSCSSFEVWVGGLCMCKPGYRRSAFGNCIRECTQYEVQDASGFCQCPNQYQRAAVGVCIPDCPPGSYNVGGKCICQGKCHDHFCDGGRIYNPILRRCECGKGQIWIFGQCQKAKKCGSNQYWCGTACVCNNGYFLVNGVCEPVPATPLCPQNSISNGVNCQCLPGSYPISNTICGQCPPGTLWNGNNCTVNTQCLPGYQWNTSTGNCQLIHPLCNPNQYWDGITCRCQPGYHFIDATCKACPYGTFFDGISCSTAAGFSCTDPYSFFNGEKCVCLPGFWPLKNGLCVTCPQGTTWNGVCCLTEVGKQLPLVVPA